MQKLKEESWEAELLVSTISFFGSLKMVGLIKVLANKFIDYLHPNQYEIGYYITFFGLMAISILISMFIIHFFLRAYWIGLLGLNSVFPDYGVDNSIYSKTFSEKMLKLLPPIENTIKKVDDLCSAIFSVASTFLLYYSYACILATLYVFSFNFLSNYVHKYILLIPVALIVFILLAQTLFSVLNKFKSIKIMLKLR
ncbi:hypothetical protein [Aquimarina agarivorans]|uniref:hypothetical protein n=1 Tax=Aquimarina agarivorans TaxID=980584 RepID=UPI000248F28B|nr:hypothetical protein [Aquimarina agarivorans]